MEIQREGERASQNGSLDAGSESILFPPFYLCPLMFVQRTLYYLHPIISLIHLEMNFNQLTEIISSSFFCLSDGLKGLVSQQSVVIKLKIQIRKNSKVNYTICILFAYHWSHNS